jgi:thiosulfate dehydrogenase
MTNKSWLLTAVLLLGAIGLIWYISGASGRTKNLRSAPILESDSLWMAPDSSQIPTGASGELIRYGKKLIMFTARYYGPRGSISHISNGMNCENCHLKAGSQPWAGSFGSVASLFPRYSDRRGSAETIQQRITDCFERSMNGRAPDSNSLEMKAMKSYIAWVGKDVQKGKKPKGTGLEILPYLDRAADPAKGKSLYISKCQSCHGANGEGQLDSGAGYRYPPLWGEHSYNTAAGIFRLSKFSGFIKDNMPYGSSYVNEQLTTEQAWDLAAFVNSQPRPNKIFKADWPNNKSKPVDLPDGPFPDSFPASQHKYGPYQPLAQYKKLHSS